MAARVKKRAGTSTDRESDKIIIRLPEGMRDALAELAARNGRSMTAEVVAALAMHFKNENQIDALRAQLQDEIEGTTIRGRSSAALKGLADLVDRLDRKLGESTDEIVRLIKQQK